MEQKGKVSSETTIVIFVTMVVWGVAYYIQKWTGIPVMDWLDALAEWLWKAIGWLLEALLELIANILPH